jgi:hypothetical protein
MEIFAHDIKNARGRLALDMLKKSEGVLLIRPISLTNFSDEGFNLLIWSANNTDIWSREEAARELKEGKYFYEKLLADWPDLQTTLKGLAIPCYLHHDYSMGSTRMALLKENGEIEWLHPFLQKAT